MAEPSLLLKDKEVEQGGRRKRTGKFSEYFPLGTVVHHKSRGFNIYDLQQNFSFPCRHFGMCNKVLLHSPGESWKFGLVVFF